MSNSKSGAILYLMVHVPYIWFVKIGITGKSAKERARGIDRTMFGFPVPVFFCFVPGAYHIEQALHRNLAGLSARFYRGDGSSEWFWIIAAPFALAVMILIWLVEIGVVWLVLKMINA